MLSFSFRAKLTLMTLVPLVLVTTVLTVLAIEQTERLGETQAETFKQALLASKKAELRNYMELGYTAIRDIYEKAGPNDAAAKRKVAAIFRSMEFGRDGYFFIYTYKGVCIEHPRLPNLVGTNLWNFRDHDGKLVIQDLIAKAREGGGFTEYRWEKPSSGQAIPKLGYTISLDRWHWVVGTGVYFDDIEAAVAKMKEHLVDNAKNTLLAMSGISIGSLLLIGFVGLAVNISEARQANRKMLDMAQKTVSFQEKERGRISRELHDGINQLLVSARYRLESLEAALARDDESGSARALATIDQILDRGIQDLRRMARDLRPGVLDDLGLSAAMGSLCTDLAERRDIEVRFDSGIAHEERLSPSVETALYRIVQEALNNIDKHCEGVSVVTVALGKRRGWCYVNVTDDGDGFDMQAVAGASSAVGGMGLRNMRDRVDLLGGRIVIQSAMGQGTRIKVRVPLEDV